MHLDGRDDELVLVASLLDRVGRFTELIVPGAEPEALAAPPVAEGIGWPVGSDAFLARLELRISRPVHPRKPGPAAQGNGRD